MSAHDVNIKKLMKTLWKKSWIIVITMILCAAVSYFIGFYLMAAEYEADILVYVNNNGNNQGKNASISSSDVSASQSLVDTYIVILKSRSSLNSIIEKSKLSYTENQLKGMISASAVSGTEVFKVQVKGHNSEDTILIANSIASVLPEIISKVIKGSSVSIVDYANTQALKTFPSLKHQIVWGMAFGFVFSCLFIIIRFVSNPYILNEEDLFAICEGPVLARIPDLEQDSKKKGNRYGYGYGEYGRHEA